MDGREESSAFDGRRLRNRRNRKGLTKKALAEISTLNQRLITEFEDGRSYPSETQLARLASALQSTRIYFSIPWNSGFSEPALSFRAPSKMSQRNKSAALAIAQDGRDLCEWIMSRYICPFPQVPDYSCLNDPEQAAVMLREQWGLGQSPIGNMVTLLESHGVFVFAAKPQNGPAFDAFSFMSDARPFVCLGARKTPERDRFDLAHELGHLVLHQETKTLSGKDKEKEANMFASALLMPRGDILAETPREPSIESVKRLKVRWGVAATALVYRLHQLGLMTDWNYHSGLIQLTKEGYRSGEPGGMRYREKSTILDSVFRDLYSTHSMNLIVEGTGQTLDDIAELAYGLAMTVTASSNTNGAFASDRSKNMQGAEKPQLKLVIGGKSLQ
jgi:Zn-dependent peptidase ImmA (M78 family)/transcriptional regulator with XRE-family HTH domain